MMASFIFVGVILFILSGVAFSHLPVIDKWNTKKINAAMKKVCNRRSLKNFIKCEVIPGVLKSKPFNPRTVRGAFGYSSGVIFATAKPSPIEALSGYFGGSYTSDLRLIWKVTGAIRGDTRTFGAKFPIYHKIRVAVKFKYEEPALEDEKYKLRRKEEENIQTLSVFELTPARYEFENDKGPILTNFIITERIDGVTLLQYMIAAKRMPVSRRYDEKTRLRLPGLRLLYIHLETMLLLERLQKEKWRHCNLRRQNVMIRKSSDEAMFRLERQLRKDERKNRQVDDADRETWLTLQFEARLVLIPEGSKTTFYITNNNHMVFIGTENAKTVDKKLKNDPTYFVCPWFPDISLIFMLWRSEKTEVKDNLHLTKMKQALKKIFASLASRALTASEEVIVLREVIEKLRALEGEVKRDFFEHMEGLRGGKRGMQTVPDSPQEQEVPKLPKQHDRSAEIWEQNQEIQREQLRQPQQKQDKEATQTDRFAAEGPQTELQPLSQPALRTRTMPRRRPHRVFPMDVLPHSAAYISPRHIKKGLLREQRKLLPEQQHQLQKTQSGKKSITWKDPLVEFKIFEK